jgi:hypothetical protein
MALSYVTYTSDGSATEFNVPFGYLARSHVHVLVDGEETAAFSWSSDTLIDLDAAADEDLTVKVYRDTPIDARLVNYINGSVLNSETELDVDSLQLFYLIQELQDAVDDFTSGDGQLYEAGDGIEFSENAETGRIAIGLFSALAAALSGGSTNEVGASVASVSLTWSYNKTITAQELAGTGTTSPILADRAQVVTGPFTTDTTFTITGHTATESDDATTSVVFQRKRHWGLSASTSLDTTAILGLSGSELSTSRVQTRTLSPSSQYVYFAWPSTFGTPAFTVNGLSNTAWTMTTVSHTNASGSTTNYDVYRSDNLLTGTVTIGVS